MNPHDPADELDELLTTLGDGELTPDQVQRLMALLKDDPAARERYTDHVLLNCLLSWERFPAFRGPAGIRDAADSTVPPMGDHDDPWGEAGAVASQGRDSPRFGWHRRAMRLAVAACVVACAGALGVLGVARWHDRALPPRSDRVAAGVAPPPLETFSGGVAVLTRAVDVAWESTVNAPAVGSLLPSGPLRFGSGIIQLEFYSGATVLLEGPAEIELKTSDRAFCRRGKLRAVVPPRARGFRIDSPAADLVDLGTEFGMEIGQDRAAAVYVFDGKVEIHEPAHGGQPVASLELTEGHGIRIGAAGDVTGIDTDPRAFPSSEEIERRGAEVWRRRLDGWLDDSRRRRADPRVVAYFPFEVEPDQNRTLAGLGPRPGLDGAIVGCAWVEGRWPGKSALEFKRPSDRVLIHVPGAFDSMTLMAWVRVDALPQRISALMLTDGFDPGEAHWQFNHEGKLSLGVRPGAPAEWTNYVSPAVLGPDRIGRWTHLATVYDGPGRAVIHHVDGAEVSRQEIADRAPIRIGDAELGNWGSPRTGDLTPVRNLSGRMDEFVLLDVALDPREVHESYERGKPGD